MSQIYKGFAFKLSLISGILLIVLQIFQWDIIDFVTVFLMPFVWGIVLILFLIALVCSLVHSFRTFKQQRYWSLLPLAVNIGVALLALFFPFTSFTIQSDFYTKFHSRSEIVEKIRVGELVNNVDYNKTLIHLPFGFPSVSKGGNYILYDKESGKLKVFFFTFRGVIDNYSGIIYKEDNSPPTVDDFSCGELLDSLKFKDNWFWMACT